MDLVLVLVWVVFFCLTLVCYMSFVLVFGISRVLPPLVHGFPAHDEQCLFQSIFANSTVGPTNLLIASNILAVLPVSLPPAPCSPVAASSTPLFNQLVRHTTKIYM